MRLTLLLVSRTWNGSRVWLISCVLCESYIITENSVRALRSYEQWMNFSFRANVKCAANRNPGIGAEIWLDSNHFVALSGIALLPKL